MNKQEIYKGIKSLLDKETWFHVEGEEHDYDGEEHNEITISTRDNGNVGDETYGQEDWDEALRLVPLIMENFGHYISQYDVTTFDEWVNIEIELKK